MHEKRAIQRGWSDGGPLLVAFILIAGASGAAAATGPAFAGPEGAGLVSVNARDVTAEEAYAMLTKAAGVRVRLDRGVTNAGRRITFGIVSEPFWVALDRLNEKTGMRVGKVVQDDGPAVTLLPKSIVSSNRMLAVAVNGPFRATLIDRTFEYGLEKKVEPSRLVESLLTLQVQPDPRLKAMLFRDLKIDELIDESGRSIKPSYHTLPQAFHETSVGAGIRLPARAAPRRIGRMKVSGQVMVATRWETIEVGNLGSDEPSTTSAAGFKVVTRAHMRGDARHVTIELTRDGRVAPVWLKEPTRIVLLKPVIVDRRNRPLQTHLFDSDWFGKMFRLEVEADQPPAGSAAPKPSEAERLRLEIPTDVKFYDVNWEFRDLALN